MIINHIFVEFLNVFTWILDRLLPFDPISRFAVVMASTLNYLPTILKVLADVYFFIPKSYIVPLISFMAAIMFLRLGIAIWHLLPWGKILG